ncbi:hypothetical protein ABH920_007883 [Catenulispora sp. EB89]|uniref:hypothetical protein n=1 Tax=Catenulispora sp. EB89 TaxID=3156257 RepID=UPI003515A46E
MSSPDLSPATVRELAMAGVVTVGLAATALVVATVVELSGNHVTSGPTSSVLCALYLVMCVYCLLQCFASARSADYRMLAPLGVLSVAAVLATFGILSRMALGGTEAHAAAQQVVVALGLITTLVAASVTSAVGSATRAGKSKAAAIVLALPLPVLIGAEIAARPTGHLAGPGSTTSATNWAEPFLYVVLLGWLARLLSTPRIGRLAISASARLALAPAVWVLAFAFTRDLASVAMLVGGVTAWRAAEFKESRPVAEGSWPLLVGTVVVCVGWILVWGTASHDFASAREPFLGTDPSATVRLRLAHLADASPGSAVRQLVPLGTGIVVGLLFGLAVAFAVIVGLLWWIARGIENRWAAVWARGLTAFLAAQCVLAFVGLLPGPAEGFPAPFLSESVVWGGADALAVAIVIGLALVRSPHRNGPERKSHAERSLLEGNGG